MRPKKFVSLVDDETVIIQRLVRPEHKFKHKFELLIQDPEFQKDVQILRLKWRVNLDDPGLLVVEDNEDIFALLRKHKITKHWIRIILDYIQTNKFQGMSDPHPIEVRIDKKGEFIEMKFFNDTTLEEIKKTYKIIMKKLKGGKETRTRAANNFDRDSFVYELHAKGKSFKEISKIIYENYGKVLDVGHLNSLVYKMQKRRKTV